MITLSNLDILYIFILVFLLLLLFVIVFGTMCRRMRKKILTLQEDLGSTKLKLNSEFRTVESAIKNLVVMNQKSDQSIKKLRDQIIILQKKEADLQIKITRLNKK